MTKKAESEILPFVSGTSVTDNAVFTKETQTNLHQDQILRARNVEPLKQRGLDVLIGRLQTAEENAVVRNLVRQAGRRKGAKIDACGVLVP